MLVGLDVAATAGRCSGTPTFNAPDNYTEIADNELFVDAVWFTLKYTVIITVAAVRRRRSGWRCWCSSRRRGVGFFRTAFFLPVAVGFASASLLFLGLLSDEIGPVDPLLPTLGLVDEPVSWTAARRTRRWSRRSCWCCGASPASTC